MNTKNVSTFFLTELEFQIKTETFFCDEKQKGVLSFSVWF
jgi:hypothetical protein